MNPTKAATGTLDRFFDCPHYEDCLDVAAIKNWPGFHCIDCQPYQDYIVVLLVEREKARKLDRDDLADTQETERIVQRTFQAARLGASHDRSAVQHFIPPERPDIIGAYPEKNTVDIPEERPIGQDAPGGAIGEFGYFILAPGCPPVFVGQHSAEAQEKARILSASIVGLQLVCRDADGERIIVFTEKRREIFSVKKSGQEVDRINGSLAQARKIARFHLDQEPTARFEIYRITERGEEKVL